MSYYRIFGPILLGIVSNLLINYLFDPINPDIIWKEYLMAILLFIPITESNRIIDSHLNQRYNWLDSPAKRLGYHMLFLLIATCVILNLLGSIYLFIVGSGHFTLRQLVIINAISFTVSIILTAITWASFYYRMWKQTEESRHQSEKEREVLTKSLKKSDDTIICYKGKEKRVVAIKNIRLAYISHGVVRIMDATEQAFTYNEPFKKLIDELPDHLFFVATRNMIINREVIKSTISSSYGKIEVALTHQSKPNMIVIPRQKASAFRKWMKQ